MRFKSYGYGIPVRQYSYVIQRVKIILRMVYTMYIDAYGKPEETL